MQACTLDGTTYDIVNIVEYIRKVRHLHARVRCRAGEMSCLHTCLTLGILPDRSTDTLGIHWDYSAPVRLKSQAEAFSVILRMC